jgi:predicted ribosomally synthesized peptide with nif11-like leader
MSTEAANALVTRVLEDEEFYRRLRAAPTPEDWREVAAAEGYAVTPDDEQAVMDAAVRHLPGGVELSEEQLGEIVGGGGFLTTNVGWWCELFDLFRQQ